MANTLNTANTANTVNINMFNTVNVVNTVNTVNTVNAVDTVNTVDTINLVNTVNMVNTINTFTQYSMSSGSSIMLRMSIMSSMSSFTSETSASLVCNCSSNNYPGSLEVTSLVRKTTTLSNMSSWLVALTTVSTALLGQNSSLSLSSVVSLVRLIVVSNVVLRGVDTDRRQQAIYNPVDQLWF